MCFVSHEFTKRRFLTLQIILRSCAMVFKPKVFSQNDLISYARSGFQCIMGKRYVTCCHLWHSEFECSYCAVFAQNVCAEFFTSTAAFFSYIKFSLLLFLPEYTQKKTTSHRIHRRTSIQTVFPSKEWISDASTDGSVFIYYYVHFSSPTDSSSLPKSFESYVYSGKLRCLQKTIFIFQHVQSNNKNSIVT